MIDKSNYIIEQLQLKITQDAILGCFYFRSV